MDISVKKYLFNKGSIAITWLFIKMYIDHIHKGL